MYCYQVDCYDIEYFKSKEQMSLYNYSNALIVPFNRPKINILSYEPKSSTRYPKHSQKQEFFPKTDLDDYKKVRKNRVICFQLKQSPTAQELKLKIQQFRTKTSRKREILEGESSGCHRINSWTNRYEAKIAQYNKDQVKIFFERLKSISQANQPNKSPHTLSRMETPSIFQQRVSTGQNVEVILGSNEIHQWEDSILRILD